MSLSPRNPSGRNPPIAAGHKPRDGEVFLSRMTNLTLEWCRVASLLDQLETRAAAVSGKREWSDETALAFETAVLSHRS